MLLLLLCLCVQSYRSVPNVLDIKCMSKNKAVCRSLPVTSLLQKILNTAKQQQLINACDNSHLCERK